MNQLWSLSSRPLLLEAGGWHGEDSDSGEGRAYGAADTGKEEWDMWEGLGIQESFLRKPHTQTEIWEWYQQKQKPKKTK